MIAQIEEAYAGDSSSYRRDEAIRNPSLAALQLVLAVKAKDLDSGPMVGFDANTFVKAFHVPPRLETIPSTCKNAALFGCVAFFHDDIMSTI